MRINQFIARSGLSSRRKAEELILSGKIFVNGERCTELSRKISPNKDTVTYLGRNIELPKRKYLILNKPPGYTSTRKDRHAQKTIFDLLPKDNSLISAGRLDRESEGLIIITNDGDFAQKIIHPSKKVEKEYEVLTSRPLKKNDLEKLENGVILEDGLAIAKRINQISEKKISLVIEDGRNRIVRRMIKALNNEVLSLKRTRIGDIRLDIETGAWRLMNKKEVSKYV